MLNAKAVSELLTRNRDDRLCKQWLLMTPNGTLLAHSQPTDMKDLRKQVARTALTWQEYEAQTNSSSRGSEQALSLPDDVSALHTLIIESETSNVLVRALQRQLLLVLEGGVPPRKSTFEPRITAEDVDGKPLHDNLPADSARGSPISSDPATSVSNASTNVLGLHRKKLDAMAAAITADFEQTGFKMPEESANKFF